MVVKIVPNDKGNPPGKLADAELHFTDGALDGLKLIGFAVWERRSGNGRNVTFPARQYAVNGERRSFALLRPIADAARTGARSRSRAAGVRRVRGDGHRGCFVGPTNPGAAIKAAPGLASPGKAMPRIARPRVHEEGHHPAAEKRFVSRKNAAAEPLDDVERKFLEPVARYLAILQEWSLERPSDGTGTVPPSEQP